MGCTVVTVSALRVSVPVLSAHKTFIDAASSTAERRVGRTPSFASARAELRRKGEGGWQRDRYRCEDCRQDEGDDLGERHLEKPIGLHTGTGLDGYGFA